jgi:hypothetical protein
MSSLPIPQSARFYHTKPKPQPPRDGCAKPRKHFGGAAAAAMLMDRYDGYERLAPYDAILLVSRALFQPGIAVNFRQRQ